MAEVRKDDPRSPLSVALALALVLHGAAALLASAVGHEFVTEGDEEHETAQPDIELIEIAAETLQNEPPKSAPELDPSSGSAPTPRAAVRSAGRSTLEAPAPRPAADEASGQGETAYSLDPSVDPSGAAPGNGAPRIDLGIAEGDWSRWVDPAAPVVAPPSRGERRAPAPVSSTGGLAEALEARDKEIGIGPAGAVLSAAHEAGYSDRAPAIGTATFAITVLRSGGIEVTLTGASSHRADWERVGESIAAAIRRKPPRIAASRDGVRIGIELVAEERWPNGATSRGEGPALALSPGKLQATDEAKKELAERNPGAAPSPGSPAEQAPLKVTVEPPGLWLKGRGKVCSYGVGLTPLGPMLSGGCDPTNIGAKARRVVSTRVVSQTML